MRFSPLEKPIQPTYPGQIKAQGMESETTMAKVNSRLNAKHPIPPWKKLHHWQGLGLVLLMLPLGTSFILSSAALEQANRQGLPEPGWADELAQNLGSKISSTSIAKAVQWAASQSFKPWPPQTVQMAQRVESDQAPKAISLRRRQRRVIANEIDDLSERTQKRLDEAIAQQATSGIPAQADLAIQPNLATQEVSPPPSQTSAPRLAIVPDLRKPPSSISEQANTDLQPSPAEVQRFLAIALDTEFSPNNSARSIPHIRKWTQDLRIQVHGQPTPTDLATLEQVVAEINDLLGSIELGFVESEPNLEIFFVAEPNFSQYEASYQPVNHGFFWSEADQGAIQRGRVLISTTGINQTERSHLIREELTQSLGLMQDSLTDANSIFFQGWSQVQAYSRQDKQLLKMLYRPDISPGMDAVAVRRVLLGS